MSRHGHASFQASLKILLRDTRGRYLILKSQSTSRYFHGKYDLPGGRINKNEMRVDFHKLINREIKEELGGVKYKLRPDPVSLSKYRFPWEAERLYILFEAGYISGRIKISDEHISFKWVKLNRQNITKLFHPALLQLLENYFLWNRK